MNAIKLKLASALVAMTGLTVGNAAAAEKQFSAADFDERMRVELPEADTNLVWYDVSKAEVGGRYFKNRANPFDRLPADASNMVTKAVWELQHHTAGEYFDFSTDATEFTVRWKLYNNTTVQMHHMPSTGVSGVDVYRFEDRKWHFEKCCFAFEPGKPFWATKVKCDPRVPYRLYFPLYNGMKECLIGVPKGKKLLPGRSPAGSDRPIVFYGTSITQGGCASRPGLGFTSVTGRNLDRAVVNLGFSGSGCMEPEMADVLISMDASCYVIDTVWNVNVPMINERYEKFVRKLVAAKPGVPVILAEDCQFKSCMSDRTRAVRPIIEKLLADNSVNRLLFHLPNDNMFPFDCETTVDGCHPNDWGMMHLGKCYAAAIARAFKETERRKEVEKRGGGGENAGKNGGEKTPYFALEAARNEVAAWRGETVDFPLAKGAKLANLPKGLTARIGTCRKVAYKLPPLDANRLKAFFAGEEGYVYDRIEWGADEPDQPRYAEITVPADFAAGVYRLGDVTLRVVDRVLPEPKDWKFYLDLWQHPWAVARWFGVKPFSAEHYAKMEPLWRELASAGQKALTVTLVDQPWNHQCHDGYGSMIGRTRRADGTYAFDFSLFDEYVAFGRKCGIGPDISCYTMCPWGLKVSWKDEHGVTRKQAMAIGSKEFEAYWGPFLSAFEAHLREKGWLGHTAIAMDERAPEDMKKIAAFVRRTAPGLKITLAGNRRPSEFKGIEIDSYSQILSHVEPQFLKEVKDRRKEGKVTTIYVCCGPWQPNTFVFSDPDDAYYLGYFSVAQGVDGLLRWAYNSWPYDPYADSSFGNWSSGDTYFVYPNGDPSPRYLLLKKGIRASEKARVLRAAGGFDAALDRVAAKYDFENFRYKKDGQLADLVAETEELLNRPVDFGREGKQSVLVSKSGARLRPPKANQWPMIHYERVQALEILDGYAGREFGRPGEIGAEPELKWFLNPKDRLAPVFLLLTMGDGAKLLAGDRMLETVFHRHYSLVTLDVSRWPDAATRAEAVKRVLPKLRRDERVPMDKVIVAGEGEAATAALWAFVNEKGFYGAAIKNEAAPRPYDRAALFAACAPRPVEVSYDLSMPDAESYYFEIVEGSKLHPLFGITGLDIWKWPGEVDYCNRGGKIGFHQLARKEKGLCRTDWMRWCDYFDWQGIRGLEPSPDGEVYDGVPDPLVKPDGAKAATAKEWETQCRPRIMDFFRTQIYGREPALPKDLRFTLEKTEPVLDGLGERRTARVEFSGPKGRCSFHVYLDVPKTASAAKPAPGFTWIAYAERSMRNETDRRAILSRGFALAQFSIWEYAPDYEEFAPERANWWEREIFGCFEHGPDAWGGITAWSWGASRALDFVETQPDLDAKHFGIVGLSRGGKTALWTGARDERYAMVCPCCSGCMGPRLNRIDNPPREPFWLLQRIQHIWFAPNAAKWADREDEFPYDMNALAACVAPRLLVITDGCYDQSAGPYAGFHTARLASPVWKLYGLDALPSDAKMPKPDTFFGPAGGCVFDNYHLGGHATLTSDWHRFMDLAEKKGWK